MAQDLIRCPRCGSDRVLVARDMKSTRSCGSCRHQWLPAADPVITSGPVGWQTDLNEHEGEPWDVLPDLHFTGPDDDERPVYTHTAVHQHTGITVPVARLRRIGWIDQKGRIWVKCPPSAEFDGGSLTPLLIDPGERTP